MLILLVVYRSMVMPERKRPLPPALKKTLKVETFAAIAQRSQPSLNALGLRHGPRAQPNCLEMRDARPCRGFLFQPEHSRWDSVHRSAIRASELSIPIYARIEHGR